LNVRLLSRDAGHVSIFMKSSTSPLRLLLPGLTVAELLLVEVAVFMLSLVFVFVAVFVATGSKYLWF
jgi:hypothetical protein